MKSLAFVAALLALGTAQANTFENNHAAYDFQAFGFSSAAEMDAYFTISDVEIVQVEADPAAIPRYVLPKHINNYNDASKTAADIIKPSDIVDVYKDPASAESWVVLGLKVWQVIANNKPVVSVTSQRVSVLPMSQPDWTQMSYWKAPVAHTYKIAAKNLFGMTVMSNVYTIAYNYGGTHNGKGAFLANATVIPTRVTVSSGFTLNSDVEVGQAVNMGGADSPVAGLEIQLRWKMASMIKHVEGANSFFISGDGKFTGVNVAH
jgi:hypothetical protein